GVSLFSNRIDSAFIRTPIRQKGPTLKDQGFLPARLLPSFHSSIPLLSSLRACDSRWAEGPSKEGDHDERSHGAVDAGAPGGRRPGTATQAGGPADGNRAA